MSGNTTLTFLPAHESMPDFWYIQSACKTWARFGNANSRRSAYWDGDELVLRHQSRGILDSVLVDDIESGLNYLNLYWPGGTDEAKAQGRL